MAHLRRLIWFALGVALSGLPMLAFANGGWFHDGTANTNCTSGQTCSQAGAIEAARVDVRMTRGSLDKDTTVEGTDTQGCPSNQPCLRVAVKSGRSCTVNGSLGFCVTTLYRFVYQVVEPPPSPQEQCEQSGGHWGTNHSAGGRFVVQNNCYPNPPRCAEAGGMILLDESLDSRCAPPQEGPCPEDIGDIPYVGNLGGGQCLLGGGTEPDPDPEPDPKPEPDQTPPGCAPNQQPGTVQGVPVCINKPPPPPTDSTDTKTETKPTPDGGTKETTTTTNTTVNNTTNTTTTTTTVTTVIKDAAGNVTGTTTDTSSVVQDSAGYCKENPGAEVCGEGGGQWAGGCDDPGRVMHECKGDPIQCAIAEQTLRTRCALAASDEVVQAFKDMVEFDGTGEGEGLDRKEISVPETLDVVEIGGGVGLVDKSYTIMGRTITVPFSAINTYLDIFGAAMMMIAWIVAFNTIRGAI